jgi:hypothetical protein
LNLGIQVDKTIDGVLFDRDDSIFETHDNPAYFLLYNDQFMPPAVGKDSNNTVEMSFAGVATPEEAAAIEETASFELSEFLNTGWKMWIVKPIRQNCPFHIFPHLKVAPGKPFKRARQPIAAVATLALNDEAL